MCFINPRRPEHFGCDAAQDNIHILLLVCGAWVTRPLRISKPISLGRRPSITSIISSELNAPSIKTRFTAPPILLGVEGGDSCGFQERWVRGGCPGEGRGRQTSCVGGRRGPRPVGGMHTRAHSRTLAGLSRLRLPVRFLIHSVFPRKGKGGLLCASLSRSLLNSCPQHPGSLSERPPHVCGGAEVRGTKPPKQLLARLLNPPLGKVDPFQGTSADSGFKGLWGRMCLFLGGRIVSSRLSVFWEGGLCKDDLERWASFSENVACVLPHLKPLRVPCPWLRHLRGRHRRSHPAPEGTPRSPTLPGFRAGGLFPEPELHTWSDHRLEQLTLRPGETWGAWCLQL